MREDVKKKFRGIYAIVDDTAHSNYGLTRILDDLVESSTVSVLQLRLKKMRLPEMLAITRYAAGLKRKRNFILIVNDHEELLVEGVDGMHIGQTDLPLGIMRGRYPQHIMGVSTHNLEQAMNAQNGGADYIGCGAVFPTVSKDNTVALGISGLAQIVRGIKIPCVAIGGINRHNLDQVWLAGAAMAAMISSILENGRFIGNVISK